MEEIINSDNIVSKMEEVIYSLKQIPELISMNLMVATMRLEFLVDNFNK